MIAHSVKTNRRETTRRPRGYLLMEATIGAAMAAVIIVGILTLIADARVKRVAAARDVLASQLVLDKIEEIRNSPTAPTSGTDTPVAGYTRTTTAAGTVTETIGGVSISHVPVTVTVSYQTNAFGPAAGTNRTAQARTRWYAP